jgi:SCY1-like protein 1
MALMATMECFSKEDLAGRVVPAMSITLVDKEKLVRDQAFRAMEMFVNRLESIAASMASLCVLRFSSEAHRRKQPETAIVPGTPSHQANGTSYSSSSSPATHPVGLPTLPTSAAGAAGALAGWAMTSFAKKVSSSY